MVRHHSACVKVTRGDEAQIAVLHMPDLGVLGALGPVAGRAEHLQVGLDMGAAHLEGPDMVLVTGLVHPLPATTGRRTDRPGAP